MAGCVAVGVTGVLSGNDALFVVVQLFCGILVASYEHLGCGEAVQADSRVRAGYGD